MGGECNSKLGNHSSFAAGRANQSGKGDSYLGPREELVSKIPNLGAAALIRPLNDLRLGGRKLLDMNELFYFSVFESVDNFIIVFCWKQLFPRLTGKFASAGMFDVRWKRGDIYLVTPFRTAELTVYTSVVAGVLTVRQLQFTINELQVISLSAPFMGLWL